MSEAAAQCLERILVKYLTGLRKIDSEQSIDALHNLCACIFCNKTDFLPFPVIY